MSGLASEGNVNSHSPRHGQNKIYPTSGNLVDKPSEKSFMKPKPHLLIPNQQESSHSPGSPSLTPSPTPSLTSTSSLKGSPLKNFNLPVRRAPDPPSPYRSSVTSPALSGSTLGKDDSRPVTPRSIGPKPPVPIKPAHLCPRSQLQSINNNESFVSRTPIPSNVSNKEKALSSSSSSSTQSNNEKEPKEENNSTLDTISVSSPELGRKSSLNGTLNSFLYPHSTCETPISSEEEFDAQSICSNNSTIAPISSDAAEEIKKRQEKKLFLVAQELTKTEEDFVENMNLLLDAREQIRHHASEEVINSIFRYVPEIHKYHKQLAEEFRVRINKWETNPKIADVLVIMGPFLKPHAPYTKEFTSMVNHLEEATKKYPGFAEALKEFEKSDRCNKLLVRHYMHKPVQRLPQYRLLLDKYRSYLEKDHPDYKDTLTAIELVSKIADFANNFVREGDSSSKLLKIQNSLLRTHEIIKPGRILLKDGELIKLSRHEPQPRLFLLCNDCLIYLTPLQQGTTYKLNHELPLLGMRVQVSEHQSFQNEFSIISPSRSISVTAKSPKERSEWLEAIKKAIQDFETRRSTFHHPVSGKLSHQLLGFEAPIWVPDTRVTMCQLCSAEFTVTYRRHHCRACGRVVCNECSSNKAPLRYLKFRAARVCDQCFPVLQEQMDEIKSVTSSGSTNLKDGTSSGEINEEIDKSGPTNGSNINNSSNINLESLKSKFERLPLPLRSSGRRKLRPQRLKEVAADDKNCSISGYLHYKKIYKRNWKKAWFVVKEKVIYRYKESNDTAALQSLPILGYQVLLVTDNSIESSENGLIFQLSHPGQNTILFKAESKESAESWIQEIQINTQL